MTAHVVETAQAKVRAAHDQEGLTYQLRREIVAGLRNLIAVPDYLPCARKNSVFFLNGERRIEVERRGQSPGTSDVGFDVQGVQQGHGSGYCKAAASCQSPAPGVVY